MKITITVEITDRHDDRCPFVSKQSRDVGSDLQTVLCARFEELTKVSGQALEDNFGLSFAAWRDSVVNHQVRIALAKENIRAGIAALDKDGSIVAPLQP